MESKLPSTLVRGWLEARSIARGLPYPVDDFGGYRVDTRSPSEFARWVFPEVRPGLIELGRAISEPRHLLKLCGSMDELCASLPKRWRPHAAGYFMGLEGSPMQAAVPEGYMGDVKSDGLATTARITDGNGAVVASGYSAETAQVFVYDRIETDPLHRRKGLGSAVVSLLRTSKIRVSSLELLVATEDGRRLYEAIGWRTLSTYSTASIPLNC